jgi:Trk K+ transport system NAD-binding subunit
VLRERGWPYVVVEQNRKRVERLRREGVRVVEGDAANPEILDHADPRGARMLIAALADPVATRLVVAHVARVAPALPVVVRVDGDAEGDPLRRLGPVVPVVGTLEAAFQMARHVLEGFGTGALEREAALLNLRRAHGHGPAAGRDQFVEIPVAAGSPSVGRSIADLALGAGTLIVRIRRADGYVVPGGSTTLQAGDALLALADEEGLGRLRTAVGPPVADFTDAVPRAPV